MRQRNDLTTAEGCLQEAVRWWELSLQYPPADPGRLAARREAEALLNDALIIECRGG